jgi:hypothetical protein
MRVRIANTSVIRRPVSERRCSISERSLSRGVTIVELLMFLVVSSILIVFLWNYFGYVTRGVTKGQAESDLSRSFRLLALYLSDDLENAVDVEATDSTKMTIKRVGRLDLDGSSEIDEVQYVNDDGRVKRIAEDLTEKVVGSYTTKLFLEMTVEKVDVEKFSRAEVRAVIKGVPSGSSQTDQSKVYSMQLAVIPRMMSVDKTRKWNPTPEPADAR